MLTAVRRYYQRFAITFPRGPRTTFDNECSCSNSCEETIELLLIDDNPIHFEEMALSLDLPLGNSKINDETKYEYHKLRELTFTIMSNRTLSLQDRLNSVGKLLRFIDHEKSNKQMIDFSKLSPIDFINEEVVYEQSPSYSYDIQERLVAFYKDKSESIQAFAQDAISYYEKGNKLIQYEQAKAHLHELFPNLEIMLEKIIVNHLFFDQFPFSNTCETFWEEFESIIGVYLFFMYITLGYMANKTTKDAFVDVIAACFRLIAHTNFDRNIDILLYKENITTLEQLASIII